MWLTCVPVSGHQRRHRVRLARRLRPFWKHEVEVRIALPVQDMVVTGHVLVGRVVSHRSSPVSLRPVSFQAANAPPLLHYTHDVDIDDLLRRKPLVLSKHRPRCLTYPDIPVTLVGILSVVGQRLVGGWSLVNRSINCGRKSRRHSRSTGVVRRIVVARPGSPKARSTRGAIVRITLIEVRSHRAVVARPGFTKAQSTRGAIVRITFVDVRSNRAVVARRE